MKLLVAIIIFAISFGVSACRIPTVLTTEFALSSDTVVVGRIVAMDASKSEECLLPQSSRTDENLVCIVGGHMFDFRIVVSDYLKGSGEKTLSHGVATCGVELPQLLSETIVAIKGGMVRMISDNQSNFRAVKESLTRK